MTIIQTEFFLHTSQPYYSYSNWWHKIKNREPEMEGWLYTAVPAREQIIKLRSKDGGKLMYMYNQESCDGR